MVSNKHPRSSNNCSGASGIKKMNITHTIVQKLEILQKLEKGKSGHNLFSHFDVGSSTIYNISKQHKELLRFFAESGTNKGIAKGKTVPVARLSDVFKLFKQSQSEYIPISGLILMEKAK